mgnify:CR=1 FL=1
MERLPLGDLVDPLQEFVLEPVPDKLVHSPSDLGSTIAILSNMSATIRVFSKSGENCPSSRAVISLAIGRFLTARKSSR